MCRLIMSYSLATFLLAGFIPSQARADLMQDAVMDYQFQDFKDAEEKFRKVLEQEPESVIAHYYMGLVLQQNGKLKEAIEHLELVKLKSQQVPVVGINDALATVYIAANMPEKALPIYKEKYETNKEDNDAALTYAKILQSTGYISSSRAIYHALIEKNSPQKDAAHFQMAKSFIANNAYATAMGELKEIDEKSPYGPAAKSYMDALAPAVKPISLYLSSEWFYHDNPGSVTATRLGGATQTDIPSSQGLVQIAALNTRAFEWTEKLKAKIGYLYYGIFHRAKAAKSNDFVGHFINPEIIYKATKNINLALKGDIQFFYFSHQKLSFNSGGTLTGTWSSDDYNSIALHANFLAKKYTRNFWSGGANTSLAYLDARTIGIGISDTLTSSNQKDSLTVDYTFNMERPTHSNSPDNNLAAKSKDSKFNEHVVSVDANIPFLGDFSYVSLLGNYRYSYKNYLNKQDAGGLLYTDATGQFITAILATYTVGIQVANFVKIYAHDISFNLNYEHNDSYATTSDLTYKSNKYMSSLSGSF